MTDADWPDLDSWNVTREATGIMITKHDALTADRFHEDHEAGENLRVTSQRCPPDVEDAPGERLYTGQVRTPVPITRSPRMRLAGSTMQDGSAQPDTCG